MLCGSWYLRTSSLSKLYVSPLLAFRCYHCYVDPGIPGPLHCRRCLFTLSFDFFISFRSCVDPDISGHLHCRSFTSIYFIYIQFYWPSDTAWTLISQDISTVGALRLFTLSFDLYPILLALRYCVDPDISGHLHCRIFRHYVHLRCQFCVDPYCKDISTVGHQIPMLRGP